MNKKYFSVDKTTPVVDSLKFESGLNGSNRYFVQVFSNLLPCCDKPFRKKYPVSNPSMPYLGKVFAMSLLYQRR